MEARDIRDEAKKIVDALRWIVRWRQRDDLAALLGGLKL